MAAGYPTFVSREDALKQIEHAREKLLETKEVATVKPGAGIKYRSVAEDIYARSDRPQYDRAMMDGFAIDANNGYPLEIIEDVFPEDEQPSVPEHSAVRVTTGAPLPEGMNAVIRSEDAIVSGGQLRGPAVEAGEYTYKKGSNVTDGDRLYEQGDRLGARDAVLLDDLGIDSVPVHRPLQVGLLATGTEIHQDPSKDRDSNMLRELFHSWGAKATLEGVARDDRKTVQKRIETLAEKYDVVVTTGGTSRGSKDYVLDALEELGQVRFHGVQFRPGKSLGVAELDSGVAFAIPGKPFAAYTITTFVLRPFFTGSTRLSAVEAVCPVEVGIPNPEFTYAIPVTLTGDRAIPLGHETSAVPIYGNVFKSSALSSATRVARSDGAVLTTEDISAGERITVVPYDTLE